MKFLVNNEIHDPEMNEAEGLAFLQTRHPNATISPITDAEAAILLTPPPKTQAEIDAEKATQAAQIVASPALTSAIEEFTSILQAASIPVPADIMASITDRVKAKL
jgi:hypothetical protein